MALCAVVDPHARYIICAQWLSLRILSPSLTFSLTQSSPRWGLIGPSRQFGTSIWHWVNIPSTGVGTFLPLPFRLLGEHVQLYVFHPARNGDQLLVVVPRRIHVPVPHSEEPFCMAEQGQLCDDSDESAVACGTTISVLFMFFTLQFPKGERIALNW